MANLSDAFGTITVKNVGQEFLDFLKAVQVYDGSYILVEQDSMRHAKVAEDGELVLNFSTAGRWAYSYNLAGYLKGEWLQPSEYTPDTYLKAYNTFIEAFKEKDGVIGVEYTDSDTAMDWMGTGEFEMTVNHGEVEFEDKFDAERVTVGKYCKLYDTDEQEAIMLIYGDDTIDKWNAYLKENEGKETLTFDEWVNKE